MKYAIFNLNNDLTNSTKKVKVEDLPVILFYELGEGFDVLRFKLLFIKYEGKNIEVGYYKFEGVGYV
jgi:hypothetical protein